MCLNTMLAIFSNEEIRLEALKKISEGKGGGFPKILMSGKGKFFVDNQESDSEVGFVLFGADTPMDALVFMKFGAVSVSPI